MPGRWPLIALALAAIAVGGQARGPRLILPNAGPRAPTWRYTTRQPPPTWTRVDFNDSQWPEGKAGFGTAHTPGTVIGTVWNTPDIWLRRPIALPHPEAFGVAALRIRHDEDVEAYLNGRRIFAARGYLVDVTAYDVTDELRAAMTPGRNVIAVHCRQSRGGQYIDVGLVLDPQTAPLRRIDVEALRAHRWPAEKAWRWYRRVGPICGCNYVPRTAVNTTEMWQQLDGKTIDQELGWAERCGLNSVRVFVQYLVYEAEAQALLGRMERFVELADRHGISVMFVLFDDCFKGEPRLGPQPEPIPGVHNSQWTASPGNRRKQPGYWPKLEAYVGHIVGHFANDKRVLAWDLYNEPRKGSRPLVEAAFAWARRAGPAQPLTTCWHADDLWDVASFHDYGPPQPRKLAQLVAERPALCTECIARTRGSTIEAVLPAFAARGIGWYMWGLVKGRIQTHYPWGSRPGAPEPRVWFHDLLRPDGTPYHPAEVRLIQQFPRRSRRSQ